jgi:hypothetical protein
MRRRASGTGFIEEIRGAPEAAWRAGVLRNASSAQARVLVLPSRMRAPTAGIVK